MTSRVRKLSDLKRVVYKIVVTRYEGPDHRTREAARIALSKLRLSKHDIAVVIEVRER